MELTINNIIARVDSGILRIPEFQRGYVWGPDDVAMLMDSLYKGYPIGMVVLWRTSERLRAERLLGSTEHRTVGEHGEVLYVLDGQQRLTSIYEVFSANHPNPPQWSQVFFDTMNARHDGHPRFVTLDPDQAQPGQHFPLRALTDPLAFATQRSVFAAEQWPLIDNLYRAFSRVCLHTHDIATDDRASVAEVFSRINRQSKRLDTIELLTAWVWDKSFNLTTELDAFAEELTRSGFNGLSPKRYPLLLAICAGILCHTTKIDQLLSMPRSVLPDNLDRIKSAIRQTVDFLKAEFNITSVDALPHQNMLVPLAVYFTTTGTSKPHLARHRDTLRQWFWRTSLSDRYRTSSGSAATTDLRPMQELRTHDKPDIGKVWVKPASAQTYLTKTLSPQGADTKAFLLMLADAAPRSFISGAPVTLDRFLTATSAKHNHHLMPKAFLAKHVAAGNSLAFHPDALANIALVSGADNLELGGAAPSQYRTKMPDHDLPDILARSLCPPSLFSDHPDTFFTERARLLARRANALMGLPRGLSG